MRERGEGEERERGGERDKARERDRGRERVGREIVRESERKGGREMRER